MWKGGKVEEQKPSDGCNAIRATGLEGKKLRALEDDENVERTGGIRGGASVCDASLMPQLAKVAVCARWVSSCGRVRRGLVLVLPGSGRAQYQFSCGWTPLRWAGWALVVPERSCMPELPDFSPASAAAVRC